MHIRQLRLLGILSIGIAACLTGTACSGNSSKVATDAPSLTERLSHSQSEVGEELLIELEYLERMRGIFQLAIYHEQAVDDVKHRLERTSEKYQFRLVDVGDQPSVRVLEVRSTRHPQVLGKLMFRNGKAIKSVVWKADLMGPTSKTTPGSDDQPTQN